MGSTGLFLDRGLSRGRLPHSLFLAATCPGAHERLPRARGGSTPDPVAAGLSVHRGQWGVNVRVGDFSPSDEGARLSPPFANCYTNLPLNRWGGLRGANGR